MLVAVEAEDGPDGPINQQVVKVEAALPTTMAGGRLEAGKACRRERLARGPDHLAGVSDPSLDSVLDPDLLSYLLLSYLRGGELLQPLQTAVPEDDPQEPAPMECHEQWGMLSPYQKKKSLFIQWPEFYSG